MNTSKYSVLFFVLIFIGSQILLIANEFAATRIIEVRKEIYDGNEKDYLKGYEIVNAPFEQFDILVKPKSFWDYLLLTNKNGNLLSIILKIAAGCCVAWYVYKLDVNDILSLKHTKWIFWSFLLVIAAGWLVHSIGLDYTRDFWRSTNKNTPKDEFGNRFYIETKYDILLYVLAFYGVIAFFTNFVRISDKAPQ